MRIETAVFTKFVPVPFFFYLVWSFLYKQCTSSLPLFQRNTNKQTQHTINFVRLLVSVTLEKREGACALFVQKTPDMFTNLPSARKTLLDPSFILFYFL